MKKRFTKRKLKVQRETVARMDEKTLGQAAGGSLSTCWTCQAACISLGCGSGGGGGGTAVYV